MSEERYGVQDSMSTDMGTHTLRLSCSEGAGTSDEHRPEDNRNEDGAGHRGREISCGPSTLGTRHNPVHLYRNVFDGNDRHVAGSSGEEPAASNGGDLRYQLMMQIMGMSVEDPALQSLQYFLAGAGRETGDTDTPTQTTEQRPVRHKWRADVGHEDNDDRGNSVDATTDNFPRSSHKWCTNVGHERSVTADNFPRRGDNCRPQRGAYDTVGREVIHAEHGLTTDGNLSRCAANNKWHLPTWSSRSRAQNDSDEREDITTDNTHVVRSRHNWYADEGQIETRPMNTNVVSHNHPPRRDSRLRMQSNIDECEVSDVDDEVVLSSELRRRATNVGRDISTSPAVGPVRHKTTTSETEAGRRHDSQRASRVADDQRRLSPVPGETTVRRRNDATTATQREGRATFESLPRPIRGRRETSNEGDHPCSAISEHGSATSVVGQFRLRSKFATVSQRQSREATRTSVNSQGGDRSGREEAEDDRMSNVPRRRPPPDNDGGGGDPSGSSSDDGRRRGNGWRRGEEHDDSDEDQEEYDDRGRQQKRRQSTSRSTSRGRRHRKYGTKSSEGRQRNASPSVDRHSNYCMHRQQIKVDKYDGSSCVEVFLCQFEDIADYNHWTESDKLAHLKAALVGSARYLMAESRGLSYQNMKEKLRRRYSNLEQQERFKVELRTRRRRADESLQDLSHDVERLVALAYPGAPPEMLDILGRDAFIDALNNTSLEFKIKERETPTMANALTMAMRLEALYKSKKVADEFTKPRHARQIQHTLKSDGPADRPHEFSDDESTPVPQSDMTGSRVGGLTKPGKKTGGAKEGKHVAAQARQDSRTTREDDQPKSRRGSDGEFQQLKSQVEALTQQMSMMFSGFEAGQPGQQQMHPNSTQIQTSVPRQPAPRPSGGIYSQQQPLYCYECGAPGHIARNCERRRHATTQGPNQPPDRVRTTRHGRRSPTRRSGEKSNSVVEDEDYAASRVYLPTKIGGKSYGVLLDTGCEITVIPAKLAKRRQLQQTSRSLIAANGTQIPILGWTTIKAYVGSAPVIISGLVSEHVTEVMLGIDWLRENEVQWDFVCSEVTIQGEVYKLAARRTRGSWCRRRSST